MKTYLPRNKNPKAGLQYEGLWNLLREASLDGEEEPIVGVGFETTAFFDGGTLNIHVAYRDMWVATLYDDESVRLWAGHKTNTHKKRLDWVLQSLGYKMRVRNGRWKVYHIATGSYQEFLEGMIVR